MSLLTSLSDYIPFTFVFRNWPSTDFQSPDTIAYDVVSKILLADTPRELRKQLKEELRGVDYNKAMAQATLHYLQDAIKARTQMSRAAANALTKAKDAAVDISGENPVYVTLVTLGVLAVFAPCVLEALGFGGLGPMKGSFAAVWHRTYAAHVAKRTLSIYLHKMRLAGKMT